MIQDADEGTALQFDVSIKQFCVVVSDADNGAHGTISEQPVNTGDAIHWLSIVQTFKMVAVCFEPGAQIKYPSVAMYPAWLITAPQPSMHCGNEYFTPLEFVFPAGHEAVLGATPAAAKYGVLQKITHSVPGATEAPQLLRVNWQGSTTGSAHGITGAQPRSTTVPVQFEDMSHVATAFPA